MNREMHANDSWFVLFVCVCIVFSIFVGGNAIHLFEPIHHTYAMTIDKALESLRSGDILLFCYSDFKGDVARFICGSWYNHVSVVVENSTGKKYIWDTDSRGTRTVPLDKKILPVRPGESLVVRMLNKSVNRMRMMQFVDYYDNQPYFDDYWMCAYNRWFPYMPLPWNHSKNQFCSMMVARMLNHLHVIPKVTDMLPCHFESLSAINGFHYSPPIYITP